MLLVYSGGSRPWAKGGGGGGGGGLDLLALSTIFLSVISSFFTQNKGGGPPDPSPKSATGIYMWYMDYSHFGLLMS